MEIRKVSPALGVEILGIDLARPLPASALNAIRRNLAECGVVFFRD
jgi:alpha-ketoglutarate-dependent taurine dioxygenase